MTTLPTFRGRINPHATDLKQEKSDLGSRAQKYFLYNGNHDKEPANVLVYKIDDSKCVVIDTDDKYTNDYVESLIKEFGIKMNRTPSLSNVFAHEEKENNPHKFHYWFRSDTPIKKMLKVNRTELDILTKELCFEAVGHEHANEMPNLADAPEFFPNILRIQPPKAPVTQPIKKPAIVLKPDTPVTQEVEVVTQEVEVPLTYIEGEKAWIDKNTKVIDARGYKTWSETMFKIHNKYNGNNIGYAIAHHFSKKDKDGYDAAKVDYFWKKIRPEKIENCVFGLGVDERAAMLNELFISYQNEIISQTKNRNKKEKQKENKNQTTNNPDSFAIKYNEMKEHFEKENFKCISTSCFVQEANYDEERKLILRNKSELNTAFQHLKVNYVEWNEKIGDYVATQTSFINEWVNDEDIRKYDRMDCYPNTEVCPKNVYNIWTPFRISTVPMPEVTEEIKKDVAFLLNHLSIMCNHEVATLQEFEKWIAQMIQHPEIKSYMPIFQSDEGAGKGSFYLLMRAMLGKSKVFETSSPDEYVWGRFNNLMETAFLVFMDEINRFMTGTGLDKIKHVVTEEQLQIQHKGKGAYTMNSFHRFAALTNAWDGGLPVNKKSRRFLMCCMSNEKIGDMDYFNKFYKLLQNDEVLRAFFEHFATKKDVPKKLPPPIQTEFQKEMSELTVDIPTLWLRDFIGDAKRNKSTLLQMKETSQMYKIINKETKTEFTDGAFVKTEIADSGEYVIELFGKQTFEKVIEWAKKNGYEKYETTPIKIIIYLLRKKWSGLTKGRGTNTGNTIYLFVDKLAEMLEL